MPKFVYVTKYWQTAGILEVEPKSISAHGDLWYRDAKGLNGQILVVKSGWNATLEGARADVRKKAEAKVKALRRQIESIQAAQNAAFPVVRVRG